MPRPRLASLVCSDRSSGFALALGLRQSDFSESTNFDFTRLRPAFCFVTPPASSSAGSGGGVSLFTLFCMLFTRAARAAALFVAPAAAGLAVVCGKGFSCNSNSPALIVGHAFIPSWSLAPALDVCIGLLWDQDFARPSTSCSLSTPLRSAFSRTISRLCRWGLCRSSWTTQRCRLTSPAQRATGGSRRRSSFP